VSLLLLFAGAASAPPAITLKAVLHFGSPTAEGVLVQAAAVPWFEILREIKKNPNSIYDIEPRRWEEIIAGAYKEAGFDEVILTPRSGDKGRDVIATRHGVGSVRFFDQVKAYKPGHVVTAEEVRAMLGVITGAQNVSKGLVTTTGEFAPRLADDEYIRPYLPFRLELKARQDLLSWLGTFPEAKATS
jgi:restriction system protein